MPRLFGYKGTSAATMRGLIESGAMTREDFMGEDPKKQIPMSKIGKDPTREVTQKEWEKMHKEQQAKYGPGSKAYLKSKQKPKPVKRKSYGYSYSQ